jgi:peptidyl-prolyl cis-trans isomerase D
MSTKPRNIVAKAVTYLLFAILIVSFGVWGIGDIFRGPTQTNAVADVGDTSIAERDFARTLSREINRLSARFGGRLDMEQARALGLVDQVLGQMIGRALFDQKAADLGMIVTEDQIKRRIRREPAFQNDQGEFDANRFIQTLQISSLSEQEYVSTLRRDIVRQQIANAVTRAVPAPRRLAEEIYRYREERRVAQVVLVPSASVTELPTPDEAAMAAFHKEFSANFMAPEFRSVSFVQLRAEDLAGEIGVSDSQLLEEFETRREDFAVPERRNIEQIVFPDQDTARAAEARLKDAASFATVAQETTGQAPVDLGSMEREGLPTLLAEAAFGLETGAVSDALETELGWHILRVTKIEPAHEPTLDEVREELERDIAMRQAVDSMISIANQFDDEMAAGAGLEEAAQSLNLEVRRIEAVDRQGNGPDGQAVADMPSERFLEVAYDYETELVQESLLTETSEGGNFVLRVDSVTPSGLRPLDEVRDDVLELWNNAQRAKQTREMAEILAKRVAQGEDFAEIAAAEGYALVTSEPLTRFESDPARSLSPTLPSKLFQVRKGEAVTAASADGHLVAKLVDIKPAEPAQDKDRVAALRESLAASLQGDVLEQFVGTLRGEYGVTINERAVENLIAGF